MEELMTTKETAKYLKLHVNTVRYHITDLPFVIVGKQKRFKKSDIVEYLKKNTEKRG